MNNSWYYREMGSRNKKTGKLNNYIVWGATAMMLSEIKDLINKIH